MGLFYYAGHGVEVKGQNYLIPLGAEIEREVEFRMDAVPAAWVLSWMEAAGNRLNMVILDACRNNPYSGTQRGGSRGLAQMDAPSGTLIAYSAAPGQVAVDGEGENSPYTAALASALLEPGLKVEDVFKRVRVAVETETSSEQTPWESSSLRGDFYFVAKVEEPPRLEPAPKPVIDTRSPPAPATLELAARAYEAAERVHTISSFQLVVKQFPGTIYADLAREQIAKLTSSSKSPAPDPEVSPESVEKALGLTRAQRSLVQRGLTALKFDIGPADGLFGRRTRAAIGKWQSSRGETPTGYLDASSAAMLVKEGKAIPAKPQKPAKPAKPAEPPRDVVREALELLSEALSAARSITDPEDRASALSDIAEVQAKSGDSHGAGRSIAEALSAAGRITDAEDRVWALRGIVEVQAKTGDSHGAARSIAEALSAAGRITDARDRVSALSGIAEVQAKTGDSHGAARSIVVAMSIARRITNAIERAVALRDIALAQASAGAIAEALSTARSITNANERVVALSDIAEVQAKAGDSYGAARSIAVALSAARSITDDWGRALSLGGIAEAQAEAGDSHGAARSIAEALSIARNITEDWKRDSVLGNVSEVQAKVGAFAQALSTARGIARFFSRVRMLGEIAEAQAKAGDIHAALSTARSITVAGYRAWALRGIAEAQAEAGDSHGAARSIAEALSTAQRNTSDWLRAWLLTGIAKTMLVANLP